MPASTASETKSSIRNSRCSVPSTPESDVAMINVARVVVDRRPHAIASVAALRRDGEVANEVGPFLVEARDRGGQLGR